MRIIKNVLSIDWDYFFNCTEDDRILNFPDPNDNLPLSINNLIWSSRYSQTPELENIGVSSRLYKSMYRYLSELRRNPVFSANIMITNSHKFIYAFMTDLCTEPVTMVHIDYHTDSYGLRDEVDCGNWVDYMCKNEILNKSTVHWIGRKESSPSICSPQFLQKVEPVENTNRDLGQTINSLFNGELPDMIFLCKSCPWSPPHLDKKFDLLIDELKHTRGIIKYSSDIDNRWTKEFQSIIEQSRQQYKQFYEDTLSKYSQ